MVTYVEMHKLIREMEEALGQEENADRRFALRLIKMGAFAYIASEAFAYIASEDESPWR